MGKNVARMLARAKALAPAFILSCRLREPAIMTAAFTHVKAAVMMAGSRDRQDKTKAGARAFARAGIRATFLPIPGAADGEMGPEAEQTMEEALKFPEENSL